jgi:hypothetical protein
MIFVIFLSSWKNELCPCNVKRSQQDLSFCDGTVLDVFRVYIIVGLTCIVISSMRNPGR